MDCLPLDIIRNIVDQIDFSWKLEFLFVTKHIYETVIKGITKLDTIYWIILPLLTITKLHRLKRFDHCIIGVNKVEDLLLLNSLTDLEEYHLVVRIRNITDLIHLKPFLADLRLKELILETQINPADIIQTYKTLTQRPVKVYMQLSHYSWVKPIQILPGLLYVYYPDINKMWYWTLDKTTEIFINNNIRFDEITKDNLHRILNPTAQERIFKNFEMGLENPFKPPSKQNLNLKDLPEFRDVNWSFRYIDAYEIPIIVNNWEVNLGEEKLTTSNPVERRTLNMFDFPNSYDYEHIEDGISDDKDKLRVSFDLDIYRASKMIQFTNENHPWTIFDLLLLKNPQSRPQLNHPVLTGITNNYRSLATNGGSWYNYKGEKKLLE